MKNISIVIFITLAFSTIAFAGGPWPQKKGKGYFKLSEWWIVFDQHYTGSGQVDPNVTTGIFNTSFYGEYGITNRFTAVVNAPLLSRNYMNNLRSATTEEIIAPGEAINRFGDVDLTFKYGLNKQGSSIPVALSLILGLPTGTTSAGALNNLQTGDGELNQILRLDIGSGFNIGNTAGYISGYTGYNNRTNGFSEEFQYGVELGLGFGKGKFWTTAKLTGAESFNNGDTAATTTSTSIFANNAEFTSIGLEANLYLTKKIGISAGFANAFRGQIIAAAPSYTVGVFYDMSK